MKAAIIVDSTAGLSPESAAIPGVFQIYLSSTFKDGTVFIDTADDDLTQQFYDRMENESELPTSSQPDPQQAYDLFDQIISEGYDTVFGLFISDNLSGTYQTVVSVAQDYQDRLTIHLIDSQTVSFVLEAALLNLHELIKADLETDAILKQIDNLLKQSVFYFVPESLTNLVKGGRLSSFSGLVGNLLSIKPLINVGPTTNGDVFVSEKIRSSKKAMTRLFDIACDAIEDFPDGTYITVGHTGAPLAAHELRDRLLAKFPEKSVRIGFITPVLGTHGGRGAISINIAPLITSKD